MKKLMSLFMAIVMVMALAVPAFATASPYYAQDDASTDYVQNIEITTTTFVPTISLQLPTLAENPVVLNPYEISYTATEDLLNGVSVGGAADQTKQVISPVYAIYNRSNVKLDIEVTATATVAGNLTLSSTAPSDTEKGNKALVKVVVLPDDTVATSLALNANDQVQTLAAGATGKELVLSTEKAATAKDMSIAAVSASDAATKWNFVKFQFQGQMAKKPTTPWADSDTLTATLAFTFTPSSVAPATPAGGGTGTGTGTGTP
jgi:hypothetical protein